MTEPAYNKPETPGLHMGFDNTVALYHVVEPEDTFEDAAQAVFGLLVEAQRRFPGWPRVFYLDVHGHEGDAAGFDADFYEFQQEFLFGVVGPFVTALEAPLVGALVNPEPQRDDVPDRLRLAADTRPHAGRVIPDAPGPADGGR
ncbi:MAG TPA: hypothetical protein VK002_14965 [Rubricoccaceae bacterium]|nr:hypothetical protein [Rubricoccaceae bacterium]